MHSSSDVSRNPESVGYNVGSGSHAAALAQKLRSQIHSIWPDQRLKLRVHSKLPPRDQKGGRVQNGGLGAAPLGCGSTLLPENRGESTQSPIHRSGVGEHIQDFWIDHGDVGALSVSRRCYTSNAFRKVVLGSHGVPLGPPSLLFQESLPTCPPTPLA